MHHIVAVFLDGSLVVDAVCERINLAGGWTEEDPDQSTIIAQVVTLRPAAELIAVSGPRVVKEEPRQSGDGGEQ